MGGQEDPNQLPGKCRCDHFSSQAKYVHIVVFDALSGGKHIVDEAGSHAGDFVRGHGGAYTAAAQRPPRSTCPAATARANGMMKSA
jgi:hypothetical protein